MDDKWRTLNCDSCRGYGVVSGYAGDGDFLGAVECRHCNGSGTVFIRPGGYLFLYPGGPACGRATLADYEAAIPYLPLQEFQESINDCCMP